jgi:hypothetical protein
MTDADRARLLRALRKNPFLIISEVRNAVETRIAAYVRVKP